MFKLRTDANKFFGELLKKKSGGFSIQFDAYYLCLLAGIKTGRQERDLASSQTTDMVKDFPGPYRARQYLILATVVEHHLRRQGVNFSDKKVVTKQIAQITDAQDSTRLNGEGFRVFNTYASGGFDVIKDEWLAAPPKTLGAMLPLVVEKLHG